MILIPPNKFVKCAEPGCINKISLKTVPVVNGKCFEHNVGAHFRKRKMVHEVLPDDSELVTPLPF